MKVIRLNRIIMTALLLAVCWPYARAGASANATAPADHPGKALFLAHCAKCHDAGYAKAPTTNNLRLMTAESIYRIQTEGAMQAFSAHLKDTEKQGIAEYLSGNNLGEALTARPQRQCTKNQGGWFNYQRTSAAGAWGIDPGNSRFIPGARAGLLRSDVKNLRLKWAFGFPGASRARSQPAIAGGGLFVGSHTGEVYALDAATGCQYWRFQASGEVRTAIVVAPWQGTGARPAHQAPSLYFGDLFGNVYAVNAQTGALRWKIKADDHPAATITGSPVLYNDHLLVPVSAMGNFNERCCTNRGAVLSLDPKTGALRWKTYTIPEPAQARYRNPEGIAQYGPAGASVMNSPTIDKQRGLLYFGTGQNHGAASDGNSDAIFALSIEDGQVAWKTQTTPGDIWPVGPSHPKNNKEVHHDFDFSASPILIHGKEGDVLVAGQKSGEVFGLNPDDGSILWRNKLGRGGAMGGVHFGMAAQGHNLFVPIHDNDTWLQTLKPQLQGPPRPGLYALNALTGNVVWSAPVSKHCQKEKGCLGYSAAITAIPGVVFAARRDGMLQAFDSVSGDMIWSYDTAQTLTTLKGDTAMGGDIAGPGPIIADGMVYVNSGYGIYGGVPGNVLLAFSVAGVQP